MCFEDGMDAAVSMERTLRVTNKRSIILLPLTTVCLIESKMKYLDVYDKYGRVHLVEDSLTRLMKVTSGFVWLSRNMIAAEWCLVEFHNAGDYHEVVLSHIEKTVKLSRRRTPELRQWFKNRSV